MPKKMPIFYSALLLTAVNLLLRLVGTSFQVYLSRHIGAEGIGLLQLVLSVGSMATVAGMAGIRTATMYLTAEEYGRNQRQNLPWVLSGSILYSLLCSAAVSILVYCFSPAIAAHWIGNPKTEASIRLFALFLPVNCLCGVMVGYFTGANRIRTLAAVEVVEQIITIACTVMLLGLWANHNAEKSCQAVVIGSGLGACLTLICLTVLRIKERQAVGAPIPISGRLLQAALPLALADDLRTGISTVENLMVPRRLSLYPGTVSPLAAFGVVCGMVFPILTFPLAILFGLTELLIPELARCNAAGSTQRIQYLVKKSLRVALLFGTACAGILFLCANSLCERLYHHADAGRYLKWFAPLAILLYCDSVTDAMIKGLGQQKISVFFNILTNTMDVLFLYLLLPKYGIVGYFFSFLVTHLLNFILSLGRLLHISAVKINISVPIFTLLSACFAVWLCQMLISPILSAACYLAILLCMLILFGVVKKADAYWLRALILHTR